MHRRDEIAHRWRVAVERWIETPSSQVGYGRRDDAAVILKVVKRPGDEWESGGILAAFGGRGIARVLDYEGGAMLLERLDPGTSLVELVAQRRDDEATSIIAGVIGAMAPSEAPPSCPDVSDWGRGFSWYRTSDDTRIPSDLVTSAEETFASLASTQRAPRLLHGDLQHYNVLFDRERGWTAIDPKGVVGELEYEIGAMLRNPGEIPDVFLDAARLQRRVEIFSSTLGLRADRILGWAFAQAVLSAIWCVQDGWPLDGDNTALRLAAIIRPMT